VKRVLDREKPIIEKLRRVHGPRIQAL
jgi:hypothetical protein